MLCLLQSQAAEEVGRGVVLAQHRPLVLLYYRSQLAEVANHQELHSAERAVLVFVEAQHGIYLVEQVGTHHGNLVDDEEVECTDNILLLLAEAVFLIATPKRGVGDIGCQGKLEKGVYRNAASIDGCHTRRSHHNHTFGRAFLESAQEGGFARTGLASKEDVDPCALYKLPRKVKFGVYIWVVYSVHILFANLHKKNDFHVD